MTSSAVFIASLSFVIKANFHDRLHYNALPIFPFSLLLLYPFHHSGFSIVLAEVKSLHIFLRDIKVLGEVEGAC